MFALTDYINTTKTATDTNARALQATELKTTLHDMANLAAIGNKPTRQQPQKERYQEIATMLRPT